jgi:hypothetical protein
MASLNPETEAVKNPTLEPLISKTTDNESGEALEEKKVTKILGMQTKREVSCKNIVGMNLILFNSLSLLLFHEVAFVYLLQAKEYFNLDANTAAKYAGDLIFWSQPFGICKYTC